MDYSFKTKWLNETPSSSAILLDHSSVQVQRQPAKIRHYFVLSLFSAICLCPATGLIALAYSIKSSAKADVNFHDKARLYSRRALWWNIVSIVLSIVCTILVILYVYHLTLIIEMLRSRMDQQSLTDNFNALPDSMNNS
ncbi:unnamed protein product [Adineta ricciae]|uniref:Uncharacterized protein n=1 Tax=Adineta ricciae TaxID=249248 RepID=A0A814YNT5_ADIRI|nr:unnamed protein product [Adineta ricciae]